jgi:cbb3-type cytochrome c oxidase subunit III
MKLIAPLLFAAAAASSFYAFANTAAPEPVAKAAAPAPVAKPDLVKGEASFAAACAACHGADGNAGSPEFPKLAQQHPEYLVKQLQEFKAGKRKAAAMTAPAAALSEQDMKNIAFWVTGKPAKPGFSQEKDLIKLGESIYRGGIADRQVPACAGCHSPNGAGIPAQYPRLSGQHAKYTDAQLKAFRDGTRKNNQQMNDVAAKLNDREIKAVSDYIAGLR